MRGIVIAAAVVCAGCASSAVAPPAAAPRPKPKPRAALAPAIAAAPYLASTRIAASARGTIVSDADSGMLVATDRDGAPIARVPIGPGAGMFAFDPAGIAYVADRAGDRVVAVDVEAMQIVRQWRTPAEPFGVALAPDRKTVLVSTIADRALVAYDAVTGAERWRARIGPAARGIAVSPDGARALVVVGEGMLDDVALDTHRVTEIALQLGCNMCTRGEAFGHATAVLFLDQYRAIASYQRAVPESLEMFVTERYGGASVPPITQHLAFISFDANTTQVIAQVGANQPRSMLWDGPRDTLWILGFASDTVLGLHALTHANTDDTERMAEDAKIRASDRCGPDGIAQAADGSLYIWCSFTRTVLHREAAVDAELREGPPIVASALSTDQHRGMVLFQGVTPGINRDNALACATCHIDGLADGLSWKIHRATLQTPALAGRIGGTEPYKWDGSDATIEASIASTIKRLGGRGLPQADTAALVAYLRELPHPRRPTLDANAVARGAAVFARSCAECHSGARYTDTARHVFASTLAQADTPSLVGLAQSAPYYHDGSARSLDALVAGGGDVHGMFDMATLSAAQRADLVAFLGSL